MLVTNLDRSEFAARCEACQREAVRRGLNGVMVWSRGGGTMDRYAGCGYFANHYQQRCYLPDLLPLWSGRSHCVLLIPPVGKPVLLVTTTEYRRDLVAVEDVRYSTDFFQLVIDTAKELHMDSGDVGLIYGDTMTWKIGTEIKKGLPELNWVPCDDILERMRVVKTPMEQDVIREACRIGTKAVNMIMEDVQEGKTEAQVLGRAMAHVYSHGACLYYAVSNSGENSAPVHSIDFPGYSYDRPMKNGDLYKVDLIIAYQGYLCDFGRTTVVGGKGTPMQEKMIRLVTDACEYVIAHIRPGIAVSELCQMGDRYLEEHGVSLSAQQDDARQIYAAFPPHWGHGLGMTWERPWMVESEDMVIQKGMYLAVEKALYQQEVGTVTYEQDMLVTDTGVELLSHTKKVNLLSERE